MHGWGEENRVEFDPSKESFVILHPIFGEGESFRLLGPTIDPKLIMSEEVQRIVRKTKPKLKALLRTTPVYSRKDMVLQYKTHILRLFESAVGALYHTADSVLAALDAVQES